ncbi:hypothetical protein [Streptomyces sp. NBC_01538]|uniref:hypothetical protein n=1 Tax=Streptomyces sp. NBC_01538 TaxID=2903897 RepID=UPI00386FA34E
MRQNRRRERPARTAHTSSATRTLPDASRAAPAPPSAVRRRGTRPAVPVPAAQPSSSVVVPA